MTVNTTKVNVPTKLSADRILVATLQLFEDWTKGKRVEAVTDISTSASATYQQAELQEVIDKLNELLGKLRTDNSNILDG